MDEVFGTHNALLAGTERLPASAVRAHCRACCRIARARPGVGVDNRYQRCLLQRLVDRVEYGGQFHTGAPQQVDGR
jgi:hypothetical protein